MKLNTLDYVLWAASFLGNVALFFVLTWKRRQRDFPFFTALIGYQALVSVVLFSVSRLGSRHVYSVVYWSAAAGSFLFQLGLIYEIARIILKPTGTWIRDARKSFFLWSLVGVLIALGLAETVTPTGSSSLSTLQVRGLLFTSMLICEVFLATSMAANRLGLRWQSHVMALGQGLTVWAVVALMSDIAHIRYGWNRDFAILDHVRIVTYLGSLAFWGISFWRPERARAPLSAEMLEYLTTLHARVHYDAERLNVSRKSSL